MVGSHLVIAAAGLVLLAPLAATFPHMNVIRPRKDATHDVSASTDPSTPRDDQDDTEDETQLSSSNGYADFAYTQELLQPDLGSACSEHVHCTAFLTCLASGTCGCPEHVPVLVRDSDSYACVSSRRLKEFCLSDAECSHTNKQARCVDSLCGCQTDFYASADGSLCMPKITDWRPLMTAMFPAMLLILALIVIGSLGYIRRVLHVHQRRALRRNYPEITDQKSFVSRAPSKTVELRPTGLDPQDASVKEERTQSICQFQLSTAPCAWSSGQDSDNSLWTTVSWVTTNEIEDAERPDAWGSIVSSSQPSWPCEQVAWKLADRKARTCETFVVQDDSRPVTLKSPGKIAIAHPSAEVSQFIDSRWPPAQDRTRWRRRVLFSDGATLSTPGSFAVTASSVQERPRGLLVGSGEGRARRRVLVAEEEASRSPRHGFQVMRLPPPPRFERGSLSLDTALATAMLRAERRAKGSPILVTSDLIV
ncbi:hypothetical protein MRX96_011729 [Rhipicephalus microplus]